MALLSFGFLAFRSLTLRRREHDRHIATVELRRCFHVRDRFEVAGQPVQPMDDGAAYPAPVRNWISRRGGLSSRLLLLRGRDLAAIYPSCR